MRELGWFLNAMVAIATMAGIAQADGQMPWQPNLETAQQIAGQTNRLVLVHFWSKSCQPCMRLEKEVFSRPEVARALEANFVMVKLNVDEGPGTARMYGVSSIPTDVILTPGGRVVSQIQSPPAAPQYIAQMNQAAMGHRELTRAAMAQAVASQPPQSGGGGNLPVGVGAAAVGQTPPSQSANVIDRVAESFRQQQAALANIPGAAPGNNQASPALQAATANQPDIQVAAQTAPSGPGSDNVTATRASYRPEPQPPRLPPGCPPLGLDGYCPVTLGERVQWSMGNVAFGVIHRGRTYLFVGPEEVKKFLANPDLYSPVLSGNDPVLALDNRSIVAGRREFGVFSDNRVYLFADEASRQRFEQNPKRYAAEALQAMR